MPYSVIFLCLLKNVIIADLNNNKIQSYCIRTNEKGERRVKKVILGISFLLGTMVLLTGCISIPVGGGDSIKLSSDGISIKSKDGSESKMSIDEEEGSFSMEGTDADGEESSFSMDSGQEIPEDFPKEIPIPKGATITSGTNTKIDGTHMVTVSYSIEDDDISKFGDLYHDYAEKAGYEIDYESSYGDGLQMNASKEETKSFSLMVAKGEDAIDVSLTYTIITEE